MPRVPVIAVTGAVEKHKDQPHLTVPTLYLEAVDRAGGLPVALLPVSLDPGGARRRLEGFDGLVLTGGGDIDPSYYGQEPDPSVYGVDSLRDEFEIGLARAALEQHVPLLAICRGLQVLNVALGGSLQQHIVGLTSESHGIPGGGEPVLHSVRLEAGSTLSGIMQLDRVESSCHHHQAIASVGRGLRPVAWADDGVIEALESDQPSVIAVQWHPEDTAGRDPAQQRLFDSLVRRAAGS